VGERSFQESPGREVSLSIVAGVQGRRWRVTLGSDFVPNGFKLARLSSKKGNPREQWLRNEPCDRDLLAFTLGPAMELRGGFLGEERKKERREGGLGNGGMSYEGSVSVSTPARVWARFKALLLAWGRGGLGIPRPSFLGREGRAFGSARGKEGGRSFQARGGCAKGARFLEAPVEG
jgi:hypothetical protein